MVDFPQTPPGPSLLFEGHGFLILILYINIIFLDETDEWNWTRNSLVC